jgi:hypothetical protein
MTIIERVSEIWVDEKKTQSVKVRSWEISGTSLPKEKNVPVRMQFGKESMYLICSHQDSDVFLAVKVTRWGYLKLKWHRLWH